MVLNGAIKLPELESFPSVETYIVLLCESASGFGTGMETAAVVTDDE